MKRPIRILILEPSEILRLGLNSILRKDHSFNAEIFESGDIDDLKGLFGSYQPEILIVNPSMMTTQFIAQLRKTSEEYPVKLVAFQSSLVDPEKLVLFDETMSVYDKQEIIKEKLSKLVKSPKSDLRNEVLSQREKEVLSSVVKGMTNKQIADDLCISLHTVITHRRNIASKLDIHSTAGLTIYAIVNNLIELN